MFVRRDPQLPEHHHLQWSDALVETVRTERAAVALSLSDCIKRYPDRSEAMARAYLSAAFTMPNIAAAFGVSVKTVSRALAKWETVNRSR